MVLPRSWLVRAGREGGSRPRDTNRWWDAGYRRRTNSRDGRRLATLFAKVARASGERDGDPILREIVAVAAREIDGA